MIHPGKKIIEEIRNRGWTQKQFAILVGKKNSEVNELIKGKRNITIQWDYALSRVLGTPEKYWINMQTDYDYELMKQKIKEEQNKAESFEVVEDIPSNNVQEVQEVDNKEESIEESGEHQQEESESIKEDSSAKPQNDREMEISEEEKQRKKEMKKIFINF